MHFHYANSSLEGGSCADIGNRGMHRFAPNQPSGIHSRSRQQFSRIDRLQIGRGKPNGPTASVAMDHFPPKAPGMPQCIDRRMEPAPFHHCAANTCTGHRQSVALKRPHHGQCQPSLLTIRRDGLGGSCSAASEAVIEPQHQLLGSEVIHQKIKKSLRRQTPHVVFETKRQRNIHSMFGHQDLPFAPGGKQQRPSARIQKMTGVRLERNAHQGNIQRLRPGPSRVQQTLVTAMNPIEISHGNNTAPWRSVFVELIDVDGWCGAMDDRHRTQKGTPTL